MQGSPGSAALGQIRVENLTLCKTHPADCIRLRFNLESEGFRDSFLSD